MGINTNLNSLVFHNHANNKDSLGMRAMWRAVITQALMDASSESKKTQFLAEKMRAKAWLKGNSDDFIQVCCLAEMDPEYVKLQAKIALSRKCKWRNDMKRMLEPGLNEKDCGYKAENQRRRQSTKTNSRKILP